MSRGIFRDVFESHYDVGVLYPLDLHRPFRGQQMLRSVDMARKSDSIFAHFRKRRQAHHLIATAVSQYRTPPSHEIVQAAQPIDPFRTRAKRSAEHTSELSH